MFIRLSTAGQWIGLCYFGRLHHAWDDSGCIGVCILSFLTLWLTVLSYMPNRDITHPMAAFTTISRGKFGTVLFRFVFSPSACGVLLVRSNGARVFIDVIPPTRSQYQACACFWWLHRFYNASSRQTCDPGGNHLRSVKTRLHIARRTTERSSVQSSVF